MTPQLVAAEMADLEELALVEVDKQARALFGNDDKTWQPEDWEWRDARRDRVHAIFHMPVGA